MISTIVTGIKEVTVEIKRGIVEAFIESVMDVKNFILGIANGTKSVVVEVSTGLNEEAKEIKKDIVRKVEPLKAKVKSR
jgi:hypothetical protein